MVDICPRCQGVIREEKTHGFYLHTHVFVHSKKGLTIRVCSNGHIFLLKDWWEFRLRDRKELRERLGEQYGN